MFNKKEHFDGVVKQYVKNWADYYFKSESPQADWCTALKVPHLFFVTALFYKQDDYAAEFIRLLSEPTCNKSEAFHIIFKPMFDYWKNDMEAKIDAVC